MALEKALDIRVILREQNQVSSGHMRHVVKSIKVAICRRVSEKKKPLRTFLIYTRSDISLSSPLVWHYIYEGDDDSEAAIEKHFEALERSANQMALAAW